MKLIIYTFFDMDEPENLDCLYHNALNKFAHGEKNDILLNFLQSFVSNIMFILIISKILSRHKPESFTNQNYYVEIIVIK